MLCGLFCNVGTKKNKFDSEDEKLWQGFKHKAAMKNKLPTGASTYLRAQSESELF